MELHEVKEMIIDLENENANLQDYLLAYEGCVPYPPVANGWVQKIWKNEEKIKELNSLLFDMIQKPVIGRPALGVTKKVSLTLPEELWDKLEVAKVTSGSRSMAELMRKIIMAAID